MRCRQSPVCVGGRISGRMSGARTRVTLSSNVAGIAREGLRRGSHVGAWSVVIDWAGMAECWSEYMLGWPVSTSCVFASNGAWTRTLRCCDWLAPRSVYASLIGFVSGSKLLKLPGLSKSPEPPIPSEPQ